MGAFPLNQNVTMNGFGNLVVTGPNILCVTRSTTMYGRTLTDTRFGLSFIGPAWSDAELISFAYDYEQRTKVRGTI